MNPRFLDQIEVGHTVRRKISSLCQSGCSDQQRVVSMLQIARETIQQVTEAEKQELERRDRAYRGSLLPSYVDC